jgi:intracellular multiplication protein IcmP
LKPYDRRLWYTLNTVGRQTPFPEVAGIFAHWVAERDMGRKLMVPMVEEATTALEVALTEIIYKPDEEK